MGSMNKLWPRLRHEAVLDLLELCKWIRMMPNSLKNIETCSNMPNIGSTFYISNNFELKHFVVDIESGSNIGHIGTSFYVLQAIWHHSYPFTELQQIQHGLVP